MTIEGQSFMNALQSLDYGNPRPASLTEQMLLLAHHVEATLRYRYGVVCLVPLDGPSLHDEDPAGVLQVQFAAGSPQEQDWLKPARRMPISHDAHADRLKQFFAGASFEVDVSQITRIEKLPVHAPTDVPLAIATDLLRPRRDILGIFLCRNGYRVVQAGNKLSFLPK